MKGEKSRRRRTEGQQISEMNVEFFKALDMLGKQKGIPTEMILERVETALTNAYKREKNGNGNVRIVIDPDKKDVKVLELRDIVETVENPDLQISVEDAKKINARYVLGGVCETELPLKKFSRISAQTAKQVIIQGIREAERGMLIEQYENKKEEIITATVYRTATQNGAVIVDTGTSRVALLKEEQIPGEVYHEGDKIKVYVIEVRRETRGPLVTLSRTHSGLVKRLFELEVPEIADGTVEVKAISRVAGARSKIAVYSKDPNVDAVGACIGPRKSRITSVVNELKGEKIDVINWCEDPAQFIAKALAPAEVINVVLSEEEGVRECRVTVPDNQLSLAIGNKGQNAKLAAGLTGYKIDIVSESSAKAEAADDEN